jgi:multimeric flavodoxin WrbA
LPNIAIVYYSRTGNTEKMAQAILEGAQREPGIEGKLLIDFEASRATVGDVDAIIVGTPTYHHDMPRGIKQFFEKPRNSINKFCSKNWSQFWFIWMEW